MEKNDMPDIPFYGFEAEMVRYERIIKHLLIALVVSIALIFISNMAWLWFFNQFDIIGDTVQLESREEGNASYMGAGASGVIDNGRSESQND